MSLSPPQARYFAWLERDMPFLLPLFDQKAPCYHEDMVERYLATASHGEAVMARFALGVWCNNNRFGFDLIDAVGVLDQEHLAIIMDWMRQPLWP